jgi:ATP-dependent RNA helicase DDX27
LSLFREKKVNFLLATDVASRGLDIPGIKTVINYDMPTTYQVYVHRCGRTARASAAGRAISLVGENDRPILKLALKNSQDAVKHRVIPTNILQKFETTIASLEPTIKEVYAQEKEEKALDNVEKELQRAENLFNHEDEIMARPKRTWFQTEAEKKASENASISVLT